MSNRLGRYSFYIESGDVDFNRSLSYPLMIKYILHAASTHAKDNGFGFMNLIKSNHIWVLARMAVEMKAYPTMDETFTIETWVEDFNKQFTSRNYRFLNAENEVIGYCRTIWSVIDMDKRTPIDLSALHKIEEFKLDLDCPIAKPGKVLGANDRTPEGYHIRFSDIDLNKHLTTSKYIEHMLDLFPLETFQQKQIARLDINFIQEALYGDSVNLKREDLNDQETILEMSNTNDEPLCRAKVEFRI